MKIIFFGSDDFALAHLEHLSESSHQVVACVTQPDRQKGRGMKLVVSPIKEFAIKKNMPVLQPVSFRDQGSIDQLSEFDCDLFVVIAYGRILPKAILDIPRLFAINVHGSLLPKYRGAAPINWAIINGDQETGISIIRLNPQMDAGDVIDQLPVIIEANETAQTLRVKMYNLGKEQLVRTIASIEEGTATFSKQDDSVATLAPKLKKDMGLIEWGADARSICNRIRGLKPWPGVYTYVHGKSLKILEAQVVGKESDTAPGIMLDVNAAGLTVSTGSGILLIKRVHFEAAKPMSADEFVRGVRIEPGFSFESSPINSA